MLVWVHGYELPLRKYSSFLQIPLHPPFNPPYEIYPYIYIFNKTYSYISTHSILLYSNVIQIKTKLTPHSVLEQIREIWHDRGRSRGKGRPITENKKIKSFVGIFLRKFNLDFFFLKKSATSNFYKLLPRHFLFSK